MMSATGEARGAAGLHLPSQPGTVEKRQKDFGDQARALMGFWGKGPLQWMSVE